MKKGKNLIFLLVVIVVGFVFFHSNVNAEETEIYTDCGTFIVENEVLKKYVWNGDTNDVVIPDGIKKIDERAFYMQQDIYSVYIPDSVTEIGELSFYSCDKLEKITGGENLINIGEWAFMGCHELKSFDFSRKIASIGEWAFYCSI